MADQEDIENCVMLHLSSSSEDENQMEIPIRKGNQKKGSPREKMRMYKQGTFHSLGKRAVWFEEETIEPCRSPQRDENTGDSDHVEEFEDHDDMDVLENDSNVQDDEIEERFSNFGARTRMNDVNQEKIIPLGRKTIIYGQTPVAIRKSQLIDMAQASGVTVEDFAKFVLESNAKQKLDCLRLYHTSKLQQLSHLFDELDVCIERNVDEIRTANHCNTSTNGCYNEVRRKSKNIGRKELAGNVSSAIHSAKQGMDKRNANATRSNVRIQNGYGKKDYTPVKPRVAAKGKQVKINQMTVVPDTESDQSDTDYIPPSPESDNLQRNKKRQSDITAHQNTTDADDQHLESGPGHLPVKVFLGTPPSSSSVSTTSSLFEPLIGNCSAHSSVPEVPKQVVNITNTSDYNQFLDTLFDSTSSNNVENNFASNRNNTLSHSHNSYQGISGAYEENKDCNKVLDKILFGDSPCSTQSQNPYNNSTMCKGLDNRKETSNNLDVKCNNKSVKSISQDNAEGLSKSGMSPTSILPSSFELHNSPWGSLEYLFDKK
ncbi:uncharacterized protein LOC122264980 isoform X2 [Penaeus japonicus]|nr:uncharacterized protein LOC122264980 isoform X2 [Penaeus japonicus]